MPDPPRPPDFERITESILEVVHRLLDAAGLPRQAPRPSPAPPTGPTDGFDTPFGESVLEAWRAHAAKAAAPGKRVSRIQVIEALLNQDLGRPEDTWWLLGRVRRLEAALGEARVRVPGSTGPIPVVFAASDVERHNRAIDEALGEDD